MLSSFLSTKKCHKFYFFAAYSDLILKMITKLVSLDSNTHTQFRWIRNKTEIKKMRKYI